MKTVTETLDVHTCYTRIVAISQTCDYLHTHEDSHAFHTVYSQQLEACLTAWRKPTVVLSLVHHDHNIMSNA